MQGLGIWVQGGGFSLVQDSAFPAYMSQPALCWKLGFGSSALN